MKENIISKIELSDEEKTLLAQISFSDHRHEILKSSCQAAGELSEILLDRQAIPEIRMEYFLNAKYNIGTKMSRKEVFERNGTKGKDILYHGHFLKYLQYFIFGPELPSSLIDEFYTKIDDDDLPDVARNLVRKYDLNAREASEEFYKLCIECNLSEYESRSIRDSVRRVRS